VSIVARSIGLVLSGGGARGAYEVGALLYVAEKLPELLRNVRVVTGTSVGAVNAAYLASHGLTPECVFELASIWRGLVIDDLIGIDRAGMKDLLAAGGKRLIGRAVKSPPVGVLRVDGIARLVAENADWRGLRKVVMRRRFDAVGFAATDIATGRTHFFVDHATSATPRWGRGDDAPVPVRAQLGPAHVLASAAIPILFPPVDVGGRWYMDGGVRYNTPLGPALGLGADALLIVSVRAIEEAQLSAPTGEFSGFGQIVGKVLDSVFLDRIAFDLDRLTRINDILVAIGVAGGEPSVEGVRASLAAIGRPRYKHVDVAHVRPRSDLGVLAARHLVEAQANRPFGFARVLRALFQDDTGTTGDAASFLLFDGGYADTLLEAGRRDAEERHDELAALLVSR
jgi:NTE family protein